MSDKPLPQEELEKLIVDFQESDSTELRLKFEGYEIHLSKKDDGDVAVVSGSQTAASAEKASLPVAPSESKAAAPVMTGQAEKVEVPANCVEVKAPYMGTFYRAAKPGVPAFVELGDEVTAETEMCLVEVMKLFTSVRAGIDGVVSKICAEDGALVQAGQTLFLVERK